MPEFMVTPEMAPGVSRHPKGFYAPGEKFVWPDEVTERLKKAGHDEKLSPLLIPQDEDGYRVLCTMWPQLKSKIEEPVSRRVAAANAANKAAAEIAAEEARGERMSARKTIDYILTITKQSELEALLVGEDRATVLEALEKKADKLKEAEDNNPRVLDQTPDGKALPSVRPSDQ